MEEHANPKHAKSGFDTQLAFNIAIAALLIIVIIMLFEVMFNQSALSKQISGIKVSVQPSTTGAKPNTSVNISFGSRLTNIDVPFSASYLSIINNAPDSNFETAGLMLLNGTLTDEILTSKPTTFANTLVVNGKPSVIYIGAISCVYCAESRWAMALALSRFGSFSQLYEGYSSFGDHDIPTIYWIKDNYTTNEGVGYGNYYNSTYINFISADYESPITQGFITGPISYFISQAPNSTYKQAMALMNSTNDFEGTPFSFWGNVIVPGATGVVFGNTTPSSTTLPLTYETHEQVLSQLKNFNDQFAYGEYAAADVYIAYLCPTLNNTPGVCQLPAIKSLETDMGL